jgi:HK97 gp10 family phage protein
MSTDTFHVKGLADLGKALSTLSVRIEKNIMRGALRAGAAPMRDDARANAAKATGLLAKGIKVSTDAKRGMIYAKVRTTGKHSWLAHLVEFATAPHRINARNGGVIRINGRPVGSGVDHPGTRAMPFMRPALDAQATASVNETAAYIRKRLTAEGINVPDAGDEA